MMVAGDLTALRLASTRYSTAPCLQLLRGEESAGGRQTTNASFYDATGSMCPVA
jgi:hypothetical protein